MKVAVVILNWNGRQLLEQFLPSVWEHSRNAAKVVVADNASTDDSIAFIKEHYPEIELVELPENFGFAGGYNKALAQVDADIHVLLNSDVEVTANWIEPIVTMMQNDSQIAACMPKIRAQQNKGSFEYAGAAGGFIDKNGYPFCRGRMFDALEEDKGQYDDEREVFWATGAALFVRAELYASSGGLDEDFFAHMEEIDLCWRLKNQGHRIMYNGHSTVYHLGGGTLSALNSRKTFLNFRNNLYLITKNNYSGVLFFKLFYRMALDAIAAMKFLFAGKGSHFWAVMRSHFAFYGTVRQYLKKRKVLKKLASNPNKAGIYNGQIVFDAFLRGKKLFSDLDPKKFD